MFNFVYFEWLLRLALKVKLEEPKTVCFVQNWTINSERIDQNCCWQQRIRIVFCIKSYEEEREREREKSKLEKLVGFQDWNGRWRCSRWRDKSMFGWNEIEKKRQVKWKMTKCIWTEEQEWQRNDDKYSENLWCIFIIIFIFLSFFLFLSLLFWWSPK